MLLQTLIWFTMIMLTKLASSICAKAGTAACVTDAVLSIQRYEHIRQNIMKFGKQFSTFNFLYTLHYFALLLVYMYSLGKSYADTQTVGSSGFYVIVRNMASLVIVAVVFVTCHRNMVAVLPTLRKFAFKYGTEFGNFDQLARKVKEDPMGFSMAGVVITYEICFEAAGTIFANVVLFAELGHENRKPSVNWLLKTVDRTFQNQSVYFYT
ncbi:uncharacterized protein LOC129582566 [Paramacrobiotus metropolitanus]|uniref:uncharacterized protein LOC129582566 n=1 Tax=Paramacrobiotus metropolitanus TaxID=2943436 RepID=UPI00244597E2|nr:uncharacterized protein LOC129582566 [Paramacrobiotus metropolitanus]